MCQICSNDFQSFIWGINTIYVYGYHWSYTYARMWDAQREGRRISWGRRPPPPHTPSPPASRYPPPFLLVVPHSQYTILPVGQGLQARGIFLRIIVLHDIRIHIYTKTLTQQKYINNLVFSYWLLTDRHVDSDAAPHHHYSCLQQRRSSSESKTGKKSCILSLQKMCKLLRPIHKLLVKKHEHRERERSTFDNLIFLFLPTPHLQLQLQNWETSIQLGH